MAGDGEVESSNPSNPHFPDWEGLS